MNMLVIRCTHGSLTFSMNKSIFYSILFYASDREGACMCIFCSELPLIFPPLCSILSFLSSTSSSRSKTYRPLRVSFTQRRLITSFHFCLSHEIYTKLLNA